MANLPVLLADAFTAGRLPPPWWWWIPPLTMTGGWGVVKSLLYLQYAWGAWKKARNWRGEMDADRERFRKEQAVLHADEIRDWNRLIELHRDF